jgi:transposase
MSDLLFDPSDLPERPTTELPAAQGQPRLRRPSRQQVEYREASLDELLPADHEARVIWEAICALDLSPWLREIRAVEGHVGRRATDPRILLALWIYATLQGEGSAREIDRLCREHLAYQWLCGGVSVNYHLIADFRSQSGEKWDTLMTDLVAGLMHQNLVTLERVAQDGMRVRANAGKSSFRRRASLERCQAEAREQIERLRKLADENPHELSQQQQAARQRVAKERAERIAAALQNRDELQKNREQRAKIDCKPAKEARASTTDPEARNMKVANGGYEPGYNVQFATDVESLIIVGVEVTNAGADSEELAPMLDQQQQRYGKNAQEMLVDGGFVSRDAITDAEANHHCLIYAPVKDEEKQRQAGKDPFAPRRSDSPQVAAWRRRMGEAESQLLYRLRAQTAEWVNARCRNWGLRQMPVRGQPKCRIVALLYAITHNLMIGRQLRAKASMQST